MIDVLLAGGAAVTWVGLHPEHFQLTRAGLLVPVAIGLAYVPLSVRFWFHAPAIASVIATACFVAAWWNQP